MEVRELTWDELPRFSTGLCLSVQRVGDPLLLQGRGAPASAPRVARVRSGKNSRWELFQISTFPKVPWKIGSRYCVQGVGCLLSGGEGGGFVFWFGF